MTVVKVRTAETGLTSRQSLSWAELPFLGQADDVSVLCGVALNTYLTMLLSTGLLHCDPHPGNLLRTTEGKLCILDWGLVTSVDSDLQLTFLEHVAHLVAKVPSLDRLNILSRSSSIVLSLWSLLVLFLLPSLACSLPPSSSCPAFPRLPTCFTLSPSHSLRSPPTNRFSLPLQDYAAVPADLVKLGFVPQGMEQAIMDAGVVETLVSCRPSPSKTVGTRQPITSCLANLFASEFACIQPLPKLEKLLSWDSLVLRLPASKGT